MGHYGEKEIFRGHFSKFSGIGTEPTTALKSYQK